MLMGKKILIQVLTFLKESLRKYGKQIGKE